MAAPTTLRYPVSVEHHLTPNSGWKVQSFEYYAAHFLVGSGLVHGDLSAHVTALADVLRRQYEIGVEHGRNAPADCALPDAQRGHADPANRR